MEKKVIVECYNESEKLLIEAIVVHGSKAVFKTHTCKFFNNIHFTKFKKRKFEQE